MTAYTPSTAVRTLIVMAASHTKAATDNQTPALRDTFQAMQEATVGALRQVVLAEMDEMDRYGSRAWDELKAAASEWADRAVAEYLASGR